MSDSLISEGGATAAESPSYVRIVAAAIDVFGSYGFPKSTIHEIAAAAHISKTVFYRHFRNKQDVYEVVLERVFDEWRACLVEAVAGTAGGAAEELRVLFLDSLEYARKRPLLNRLLIRDSQLVLSNESEVWDRAHARLGEVIEQILRRGVETGEVRDDVSVAHIADLLTEIHYAYSIRQLVKGQAMGADLAEAITACMWGGLARG